MTEIALDAINVLVIGDSSLQAWFEDKSDERIISESFNFTFSHSIKQARHQLKSSYFDLMVFDYDLPDGTGLLMYETLKVEGFVLPKTLLVSSDENEQLASEWFRRGGDAYISWTNLETYSLILTIKEILCYSGMQDERDEEVYWDSVTDLWNPRYLIRLLDDQRLDSDGDYPIGCSMVEIPKKSTAVDIGSFGPGDNPLRKAGQKIHSVIAHSGIVGRYWGSMFWTFFRNKQVGQLHEKIQQALDAVDDVFSQEENADSFAGAIMTERSTLDFEQLQKEVDKRLFKAKQTRGSRFMIGRL